MTFHYVVYAVYQNTELHSVAGGLFLEPPLDVIRGPSKPCCCRQGTWVLKEG